MPSLETSFFDRLRRSRRSLLRAAAALSLSKKSPKGGFFGKIERR